MLYVPDFELNGPLFDPERASGKVDDEAIEKLVERLYCLDKPAQDKDYPIQIHGQTSYVEQ